MLTKKILFLVLLFCTAAPTLHAQDGEQESNLKAAFIYSFTKYIDWGNYNHNDVFVIGVIGDNSPIISPLREIAKRNTINYKRIEIKILQVLSDEQDCNIVFIPKECRFPLSDVLAYAGRGVLTISEANGYASMGTDFNFVIINEKLKFEANLNALASSGLKAGSQLLKLAIIVGGS